MKKQLKQLISFSLALMIGFFSPLYVYATDEHPWQGGLGLQLYYNKDDVKQYIKDSAGFWNYAVSQVGSILVDHDFKKFAENSDAFDELTDKMGLYKDTSGNIQGVYLPEDFMSQLKDLLDQYAKENEPYYIVPVSSYKDLDPTNFSNKAKYDTLCHFAKEYGMIAVNGNYIADLSNIEKEGRSFVACDVYNEKKDWYVSDIWTRTYNTNWEWKGYNFYIFDFDKATEKYTSFDQGRLAADISSMSVKLFSYLCPNYSICHNGGIRFSTSSIYEVGKASIIARDRVRVRVYKTLDDYKRYSVGKRHIYYTPGYYDYVPGDISISTEDLEKGIDDINTALDKLLESINGETSETDIENLLQQILDELKNSGGSGSEGPGIGDGSDNEGPGGSTGDFDGLLDLLSSYFNSVLAKLDAIIQGIDGLLWFESTEDDEDDPTNDLADMLKKILDDPQTGSQEVADSLSDSFLDVATGLTKKFPFSIPWDVYGFFNVFANVSSPPPQTRTASYDDRGIMLYPAPLGDDIRILAGDTPVVMSDGGRSATDAPYFELPIVVESFGIDEVIIVDLEGFTSLSTFSRVMLSCIFGIFLIKWTIAFISAFNEIMPGFFDD